MDLYKQKVLKLKVIETSNLKADNHVIHPFVRMHLVHLKSGTYLQKSDFQCYGSIKQNSIYQHEDRTVIEAKQGIKQRCDSRTADYIPPFATNPCDLRVLGKARAEWGKEIIINLDVERLVDSDVLLLFELVDFSPMLILDKPQALNRSNLYPIAWGYLRISGLSQYHIGDSRLQLYHHIFDSRKYGQSETAKRNMYQVPDVYFDFIWPLKRKYEGYLAIEISPVNFPKQVKFVPKEPYNIFEEEVMGDPSLNRSRTLIQLKKEDKTESEKLREARLRKIRRFAGESCKVPDEHLYKFKTERLGCNTVAFSPDGKMLAASVTKANSRTWVNIYNVEDGILMANLPGHNNLVHDLSWHSNSQFLLTSSSDMSCKLWKIPLNPNAEKTTEEVLKETFMQIIPHPSYVYAGKLYPEHYDGTRFLMVTGCFDGKVRVYCIAVRRDTIEAPELVAQDYLQEDFNRDNEELIDMRHPNCVVFGEGSNLFIGDNKGTVHQWELLSDRTNGIQIRKIRYINDKEITGDTINIIHCLAMDKIRTSILTHTRDNCIRRLNYEKQRVAASSSPRSPSATTARVSRRTT